MPKRFTAHQIEKILKSNGFLLISQKGSHRKWKNARTGEQVIVPYHSGRELPVGTSDSIIKGSVLGRSGVISGSETAVDWRDAIAWRNALTEYYNSQNDSQDNPYVNENAKGFRLPGLREWGREKAKK